VEVVVWRCAGKSTPRRQKERFGGGPVVAVLGGGIDVDYPAENRAPCSNELATGGGAV